MVAMIRKRPMLLDLVRELTLPIARSCPVETMPAAIGSLHNFSLPRGMPHRAQLSPSGGANINLLLRFASETRDVHGDIAQCGVYKGGTPIFPFSDPARLLPHAG
jgi:hypothetical protein